MSRTLRPRHLLPVTPLSAAPSAAVTSPKGHPVTDHAPRPLSVHDVAPPPVTPQRLRHRRAPAHTGRPTPSGPATTTHPSLSSKRPGTDQPTRKPHGPRRHHAGRHSTLPSRSATEADSTPAAVPTSSHQASIPTSRSAASSSTTPQSQHLTLRSIRHDPPDISKLAKLVVALTGTFDTDLDGNQSEGLSGSLDHHEATHDTPDNSAII